MFETVLAETVFGPSLIFGRMPVIRWRTLVCGPQKASAEPHREHRAPQVFLRDCAGVLLVRHERRPYAFWLRGSADEQVALPWCSSRESFRQTKRRPIRKPVHAKRGEFLNSECFPRKNKETSQKLEVAGWFLCFVLVFSREITLNSEHYPFFPEPACESAFFWFGLLERLLRA